MKIKWSQFKFKNEIFVSPMVDADWESAEDLLAEMVARAITAEHPEWFGGFESECKEVIQDGQQLDKDRTDCLLPKIRHA